jgi:hypothetical protein
LTRASSTTAKNETASAMDPVTLMLLAGLGFLALSASRENRALIGQVEAVEDAAAHAADPAPEDTGEAEPDQPNIVDALKVAAVTAGISLAVGAVRELLAERKAGIEAFKVIWPLMNPGEQRRWIRKKHKALHANILELARRSKDVRLYEESMVSKYKRATESEMVAIIESNMRYVWWSPKRLSHSKVHTSPLRKATLTVNLWELKVVDAVTSMVA